MKNKVLSTLLAIALIFCITGCGDNKNESTSEIDSNNESTEQVNEEQNNEEQNGEEAEKKELEKVSIVLDWYPNAIHCFLYNAIEKGYFAEEGLELEILFPAGTTDGISMPAAGNSDFGVFYMRQLIKARADENVPVKSIGAILQKPVNVIVSLKDKKITSPKDLEGKKVGYCGMDISKQMIIEAMKADNADPSSVEFIDVGFDLMNAMTSEQVDATIDCLENHEVPFMENQGLEVNYFSPNEYSVPEPYEMVLVTSDKTIEEDPEKVNAFLRACAKGFEDMKNDKKGSLDILFANQNAENFPLERGVEEKSLDILLNKMETAEGKFLVQKEAVYQENIKWMQDMGFLENEIDPSELIYKAE